MPIIVNEKSVLYGTEMEGTLIPMPRRREARRNERRRAIVEVAREVFLERGYATVTMSEIASHLGGSKSTLWSYFPSKEQLFAAVVDCASERFREQITATLNPCDDVDSTIERFCEELLTRVTAPSAIALHRLVIGESHRFPGLGSIFYNSGPLKVQQMVGAYLAEAMSRGAIRAADPLLAAKHLIGSTIGGVHHLLLMGVVEKVDPQTIAAEARAAAAGFLRGYAAA